MPLHRYQIESLRKLKEWTEEQAIRDALETEYTPAKVGDFCVFSRDYWKGPFRFAIVTKELQGFITEARTSDETVWDLPIAPSRYKRFALSPEKSFILSPKRMLAEIGHLVPDSSTEMHNILRPYLEIED